MPLSDKLGILAHMADETYTRDEFEAWLNKHADDALDMVDQKPRSLAKWAKSFAAAIQRTANDETGDDPAPDDDDDDDLSGGIFGDD